LVYATKMADMDLSLRDDAINVEDDSGDGELDDNDDDSSDDDDDDEDDDDMAATAFDVSDRPLALRLEELPPPPPPPPAEEDEEPEAATCGDSGAAVDEPSCRRRSSVSEKRKMSDRRLEPMAARNASSGVLAHRPTTAGPETTAVPEARRGDDTRRGSESVMFSAVPGGRLSELERGDTDMMVDMARPRRIIVMLRFLSAIGEVRERDRGATPTSEQRGSNRVEGHRPTMADDKCADGSTAQGGTRSGGGAMKDGMKERMKQQQRRRETTRRRTRSTRGFLLLLLAAPAARSSSSAALPSSRRVARASPLFPPSDCHAACPSAT